MDTQSPTRIGFLRSGDPPGPRFSGLWVECLDCARERDDTDGISVYDINLRPYRQPCGTCGKELIEPHCGVVLFSGKPEKAIDDYVHDENCQKPADWEPKKGGNNGRG